MPEATITVTGSYLTPTDQADTVTVTFVAADTRDITNAKIALQKPVTATTTSGAISQVLLATPGGYRVTESNGVTSVSYVIGGTVSIDLSSVNPGTAQFDASGIGVMVIEDIPSGATYTSVLADVSKQKRSISATAQTFRVDGSVPYGIGATFSVLQWAAGRITLSGINGATLRQADSAFITRKQYSEASLEKVTATEWLVVGDVSVT